MVIRHIVLVRFDPATDEAERRAVLADLAALRGTVPGLRAFAGGPNVSPEGLARGYTHAFTVEFDDEAARDAYLVHPAHRAAGARLTRAAAGGTEGLAVVDIVVEAS